eukprot:TRINITY_DN3074_c0_g1_i1.p1 TRINITY_DN3074_c0_g1~~TRINITY_DN3074_c0_g1_i1.p1  ORF type:complete len:961 (-),score=181.29 TRINITY_DN3074_c0_g1_i1:8-2890(-)
MERGRGRRGGKGRRVEQDGEQNEMGDTNDPVGEPTKRGRGGRKGRAERDTTNDDPDNPRDPSPKTKREARDERRKEKLEAKEKARKPLKLTKKIAEEFGLAEKIFLLVNRLPVSISEESVYKDYFSGAGVIEVFILKNKRGISKGGAIFIFGTVESRDLALQNGLKYEQVELLCEIPPQKQSKKRKRSLNEQRNIFLTYHLSKLGQNPNSKKDTKAEGNGPPKEELEQPIPAETPKTNPAPITPSANVVIKLPNALLLHLLAEQCNWSKFNLEAKVDAKSNSIIIFPPAEKTNIDALQTWLDNESTWLRKRLVEHPITGKIRNVLTAGFETKQLLFDADYVCLELDFGIDNAPSREELSDKLEAFGPLYEIKYTRSSMVRVSFSSSDAAKDAHENFKQISWERNGERIHVKVTPYYVTGEKKKKKIPGIKIVYLQQKCAHINFTQGDSVNVLMTAVRSKKLDVLGNELRCSYVKPSKKCVYHTLAIKGYYETISPSMWNVILQDYNPRSITFPPAKSVNNFTLVLTEEIYNNLSKFITNLVEKVQNTMGMKVEFKLPNKPKPLNKPTGRMEEQKMKAQKKIIFSNNSQEQLNGAMALVEQLFYSTSIRFPPEQRFLFQGNNIGHNFLVQLLNHHKGNLHFFVDKVEMSTHFFGKIEDVSQAASDFKEFLNTCSENDQTFTMKIGPNARRCLLTRGKSGLKELIAKFPECEMMVKRGMLFVSSGKQFWNDIETFVASLDAVEVKKTNKMECDICFEDITDENYYCLLGCKHDSSCKNCLTEGINNAINDLVFPVTCTICNLPLEIEDFNVLIPDDKTLKRFYRNSFNKFKVDHQKDFTFCLTPDCEGLSPTIKNNIYNCRECSTRWCIKCKLLEHPTVTCEQAIRESKMTDTEKFDEWKAAHTKPCAKCNSPIEKTHGCNHMTCGVCSSHFCWLCTPGGPISSTSSPIYDHLSKAHGGFFT